MADRFHTSIVIPVFNEAANLEKLLKKINAFGLAGAEIVVVDDGSTDDSALWLWRPERLLFATPIT